MKDVSNTPKCDFCGAKLQTGKRRSSGVHLCEVCVKRATVCRKYNMTLQDYARMLCDQEGKCAICTVPLTEVHIDHCHENNHVRGLLCVRCNTTIGRFNDSYQLLKAAALYVFHNRSKRAWCAKGTVTQAVA